jgi:hypothetical protein
MPAKFVTFALATNQYDGVVTSWDSWCYLVEMHAQQWGYKNAHAHHVLLGANRTADPEVTFSLYPEHRGKPTLGEWAAKIGTDLSITEEQELVTA